jgi:putative ABC transport system ATP-binding protein
MREIRVLDGVSLELHAGEFIVVWGRRRSGKTTLASIAGGLLLPNAGTVSFRGENLASADRMRSRRIRKEIAFVGGPESHHIPDRRRVIDYVSGVRRRRSGFRKAHFSAYHVLEELELSSCASDQWGSLGDQDRALVMLAKALMRRPKVLVLDDLTVYLDGYVERVRIERWLRQVADEQGLAILQTTDAMATAIAADTIATLVSGGLLMPKVNEATVVPFPARRESA